MKNNELVKQFESQTFGDEYVLYVCPKCGSWNLLRHVTEGTYYYYEGTCNNCKNEIRESVTMD